MLGAVISYQSCIERLHKDRKAEKEIKKFLTTAGQM